MPLLPTHQSCTIGGLHVQGAALASPGSLPMAAIREIHARINVCQKRVPLHGTDLGHRKLAARGLGSRMLESSDERRKIKVGR